MGNLGLSLVIAGGSVYASYEFFRSSYLQVGGWQFAHEVLAVGAALVVFGLAVSAIEMIQDRNAADALVAAVQSLAAQVTPPNASPCPRCNARSPALASYCVSCGAPLRVM